MEFIARLALSIAACGFGLTAPVAAENGSSAPKERDPNQIVCEKQEVLGSRLAVKRVCMTRAEWADHKRVNRDLVQNSQLGVRQKNPCNKSGC